MNNPPKTGADIRARQTSAALEVEVIAYRGQINLLTALLKRVIASSVLSFEQDGPEELVSLEADICAATKEPWEIDMDYRPEELGSPEPDEWDQSALAYHLSIAEEVQEMSGHAIPKELREDFSQIEDQTMQWPSSRVFTQMRTATQAYFEAARRKPLNAPVEPTDLFFVEKVLAKLSRFNECAQDGQDADIGWHWFDILVRLSLLNRVRKSPALWELTAQGEIALAYARNEEAKRLVHSATSGPDDSQKFYRSESFDKAARDVVSAGLGAIQVKHISLADMRKRYECQLCLRPYSQCVCSQSEGL